eukprot:TRINITY_DN6134_c0_g1_i1.p1 TRINITY_DN6134_c0_g1~~TRINITY_DN6134_c0_g1_i1.p1  ORF type:complete len:139 (-),score=26.11 TRINITY_DN6134_c0_g1_i1:91-507(-)
MCIRDRYQRRVRGILASAMHTAMESSRVSLRDGNLNIKLSFWEQVGCAWMLPSLKSGVISIPTSQVSAVSQLGPAEGKAAGLVVRAPGIGWPGGLGTQSVKVGQFFVPRGPDKRSGELWACYGPVSYTHLTLPTKRIV